MRVSGLSELVFRILPPVLRVQLEVSLEVIALWRDRDAMLLNRNSFPAATAAAAFQGLSRTVAASERAASRLAACRRRCARRAA